MTIDEAIKHAEEVMAENLEKTKGRNASDPIAINCFECAEEHRQLVEWLKDYKRLKKQEPCDVPDINVGDMISRQAALGCCRNEWEEEVEIRIKSLPPVTPQQKTGHWIKTPGMNEQCDACGGYFPLSDFNGRHFVINYYPNCGAKMV